MEPEDSLPYSQEHFTEPYSEPHESSPHSHILFNIRFNIILSFTHRSPILGLITLTV